MPDSELRVDALRIVKGARGPTLLVVDDDPVALAFASTVLRGVGYEVIEAPDGGAALDILRHTAVQLVILDHHMPGLTGVEVVRRIRDRSDTRTLPVILLTAADGLGDRVTGLDAGADDYVLKPVDPRELVARVGAQLRGHDAWQRVVQARLLERAALAHVVRAAGHAEKVEHAADALVLGVTGTTLCEGAAVLAFTAGGTVEVLSSAACRDLPARSLLSDQQCSVYREIAGVAPIADRTDGSVIVPLRHESGVLGLLLLRGSDDLDSLLAAGIDLAEMTTGLLGSRLERRMSDSALRTRIAAMIERRSFRPHYQPIVDLRTGELVGVEALTRFDDGVPPLARLREAAAAGMVRQLEQAMVDAAVEDLDRLPADAWVSVNVSPDLVLTDQDVLGSSISGAHRPIVLELSEQDAVDDYDAFRVAVRRLGGGVQLSVDDAGSGFASLHHILELAPAFVKLDRSWVRDVDEDPARQALIAGVRHFADTTGSQVIAEGVERTEERDCLDDLGVVLAQGFLFGRPEPLPV